MAPYFPGSSLQLQYIATTGASDVAFFQAPSGDWYAVVSSREDSGGSPNVDSLVLRWNGARFESFQSLATIGAAAIDVFSISGSVYLAFASSTDTRQDMILIRNTVYAIYIKLWCLAVHYTKIGTHF